MSGQRIPERRLSSVSSSLKGFSGAVEWTEPFRRGFLGRGSPVCSSPLSFWLFFLELVSACSSRSHSLDQMAERERREVISSPWISDSGGRVTGSISISTCSPFTSPVSVALPVGTTMSPWVACVPLAVGSVLRRKAKAE